MAYSYVREVGDGSKTSFSFNFVGSDEAYLRQSDIEVTVDKSTVPFTFLSSNTIELGTAPADGAVVLIRRIMPKAETYADFQRGNNFGQEVLNNSFLQLLYVVHELLDGWFPEGFTVRQAVTFLEDLLFDSNLHVNGSLTTNGSNSDNPDSVVTFDEGDSRYINESGDTMRGPLHVNGSLTTNGSNSDNPDSVVTFDEGDSRYINESGDTMRGPLHVNEPEFDTEPARKGQLDEVISNYQSADANLQSQMTGEVPMEASAFSPISWHDQVVENSVTIPENKNAWSFGPSMTIAEGQSVTIRNKSYWTISDGQTFDEGTIQDYDGGEL